MQRLTTKFKDKFHQYRSRSRSPSLRDDPLQSLPNVQTSTSAPSATSDSSQNASITPTVDVQNRYSLPIPTINEPAHEQESSVQDPPAEAGIELAVEPVKDDETIIPTKTLSEEIWDYAYDELKAEEPALVQAYERILTAQLLSGNNITAEAVAEVNSIDQHDKENRRSQMQELVKNGLDRISRESKAKSLVDDFLPFINVSKDIVTNVVKGVPQAALPWAMISLSLELLTNPISETKANCTGVTHVVKQMNWYCEIATLVFGDQDGITAGLQGKLQTRLIDLYKKLLSFEMKSVCSYYRHRGLVFLGDLIKLDDWKGTFKELQDAEAFFKEQFHTFQSIDLGQDVKQLVLHVKDEQAYRKTDDDKKCLRDLYITDPRMDKSRIERTKGGLVQDSWRWILTHPDYETWLHDDDKRLLWVRGDPGKGKTMLLCGLVDDITKRVTQSGQTISYFFCQATMPTINNHLAVLRGLIWLLADQQPSLISHIREKYDPIGKDVFEGANAWYSLSTIFRNILRDKKLTTAYVILDGLDECTAGLIELLELIKEALPFKNVKWIMSSRNWPEIQARLEDTPNAEGVNLSLEVNATVVAAAVDAYILRKVSEIPLLKGDGELKKEVFELVREKANGTFLWVAIVFQQLQRLNIDYDDRSSVLRHLHELPNDLTELYDRMLKQIERFNTKHCQTVLGISVLAYRPLRLQELATLAGFKERLASPSALERLIQNCGSFLTVKDETVYFIHQSSKEYLTTNGRAQSTLFANGIESTHHQMVMHSLETMGEMLCRDIYKIHNDAILIDDISTPKPDPLVSLGYSCSYWLRHLCVSMTSFDLGDGKVLKFLKAHILHWLEVMSLKRNSFEGVPDVIHFESLLEQHYPESELLHLVHDIRRFMQHNLWIINNAPLQIYTSAILFTPRHSIVRSLFEKELLSWITVKPFVESHWSPCLQIIETIEREYPFLALSADKTMLASGEEDELELWDVASGKRIRTLELVKGIKWQFFFSRDSKQIFAGVDEHIVSWDVDSGIAHHHTWSLGACPSFSNDGKFVASHTIGGKIQIQDINTGKRLYLVQHLEHGPFAYGARMELSNGAKYLAFGDEKVTIWDLEGRVKCTVLDKVEEGPCFSSDSMLLAYQTRVSSLPDNSITIWDLAMRREVRTISADRARLRTLEFSTDSKLLAGATGDQICIWDAVAGTLLTQLDVDGYSFSFNLCWSQDCTIMVSSNAESIQVWDATAFKRPEPIPKISTDVNWYTGIATNNEYKLLATRTEETIKVWDTTTGSEIAGFEAGCTAFPPLNSMAFSPDSNFLYASGDAGVTRWNIGMGTQATDPPWLLSDMKAKSFYNTFSSDGRLFATATVDGHVIIWDLSTGLETLRFPTGRGKASAMAFSNNAKYLSLSFPDWGADVWNVSGGQIMHFNGPVCERNGNCEKWDIPKRQVVAVSNNARRVLVGVITYPPVIWIHNEGQKMIKLILDGHSFDRHFGAKESHITTRGGYVDLDGLQIGCETPGPYNTITSKEIRFEGYGLSSDRRWITWNGSNVLWLPVTYQPYTTAFILPLSLLMAAKSSVFIRFSGPPPR